jgi:FKBP-type peptidyl-prolyl cis-trans isomerase (trigger factor)
MITKQIKEQGLQVNKTYEKKRKILEDEVNEQAIRKLKISSLLEKII